MSDTLSSRKLIARKPHRCWSCYIIIPAGAQYRRSVNVYDGRIYTWKSCSRHATYHGNVEHIVGEVKGPNTLGEPLTAVTATPDTTRAGFAYGVHREAAGA